MLTMLSRRGSFEWTRSKPAIIASAVLFCGFGCGGGGGNGGSGGGGGAFARSYAGTWNGTWVDTTNSTNGIAMMTIVVDGTTHSVTLTMTLSGGQFGFSGQGTTLTGTYDANGITVAGVPGTGVGTINLTIDRTGLFTGTAANISANITSVDFGGPSTSQSVTLTVTVHHANGTTANGTIMLTK